MIGKEENVVRPARLNRKLTSRAEAFDSQYRAVLDMNSAEIAAYGDHEQSAYNRHFRSTCYHPLLLFNRERVCLAAKLHSGSIRSAEGSD